jgi:hypothetical protein
MTGAAYRFDLRLGDEVIGYVAEENLRSVAEILPWLQEAIAHFYPESSYPASLSPEIRESASTRLFRPPKIGARATVFDGPGPDAPRFVEVEDKNGRAINFGEWVQRRDGYWVLRIPFATLHSSQQNGL